MWSGLALTQILTVATRYQETKQFQGPPEVSSSFQLGNLLAFKGVVSHEGCLILYGLGARLTTLADSRARTLESCLNAVLKPGLLAQPDLNALKMLEERDGIIERLQV